MPENASEPHGCYVIEIDGESQRIHGVPTDDPQTLEAIRAVIRAARKQLDEQANAA